MPNQKIYTLQNIDYCIERGKPVIYIYARDEEGNLETFTDNTFKPYFYIRKGEIYKTVGDREIKVTDIYAKTIDGREVLRIETRKPTDVSRKRKEFVESWESDILYPLRYMIDRELYCTFEWEDERPVPVEATPVPPKVLFIDIEVGMPEGDWSGPFEARHPIICISYWDSYDRETHTLLYHPEPSGIEKRKNLKVFNEERELMEVFISKLSLIKPDLISGWNVSDFDLPYIITRMQQLGMDPNYLSPLSFVRAEEREGFWSGSNVKIKGLSVLDLLAAYRKFFAKAFPSYALQAIAQKDLGESKVEIDNFRETWIKNPSVIVERNALDVEFLHRIDDKWKLIDHYSELKNLIGTTYHEVLSALKLIDAKMLRKARERGVVLPKVDRNREDESYAGAFVMTPEAGIYENVIVMDYKSLYPSIFTTYNISTDTLTTDEMNTHKVINWNFKKEPVGILPECVIELQKRRSDLKDEMKKHSVGSEEYERLNSKQTTTKYLINAFYGVFGYTKFRLYSREVAEAVTLMGQEYVKQTVEFLRRWGYNVLYGDTDSVFVVIPGTLEDALSEGEKLANDITNALEAIMGNREIVIEFEKVYSKILFGNVKKRYAGIKIWDTGQETDKLDVTGFEVKRSDSAPISVEIQKKLMNIMLKEDVPEVTIKEELQELFNTFNDLPFNEIAIPKGIKKDLNKYGGINVKGGKIGVSAIIRGAKYANEHFGTNYGAGSKPKMLYIKHMPKGFPDTDVVAFDDDTVLPDGIIPDYTKMWNTVIKAKVRPLLDILGMNFEEVVTGKVQVRLDEYIF